jgi:ArsR family transcriptional regulator, arsenate/arsenite/antimonite-responsive transcriptional repressor
MAQTSTRQLDTATTGGCCTPSVVPVPVESSRTVALAGRLKALADPTRLRMLELLVENPEPLCVCEFTAFLPQRQPTISHHLKLLRTAGLVNSEKRGVWSYFWATEEGKRSLTLVHTLF